MKISGYERIDSEKDGRSTHGVMIHRSVPILRANSNGFKTAGTFVSDSVLSASGLDMSDIVTAFVDGKDIIIETIQNGTFTQVVSVMII